MTLFDEIREISRRHLSWVDQSDATLDILSLLIASYYTGDKWLSADQICELSGYARSTVSGIIGQLEDLKLVTVKPDTNSIGQGRRRNLYRLLRGFRDLFLFEIRKVALGINYILRDLSILHTTDLSDDDVLGYDKFKRDIQTGSSLFSKCETEILSLPDADS
jgi:DNA-binding MarR family transcriptional regulator